MKKSILPILCFLILSFFSACDKDEEVKSGSSPSVYTGTASVSQGPATTTNANLYSKGQRIAGLGSVLATDNTTWIVPADVHYQDTSFPFAPDLFNPDGIQHATSNAALGAFDPKNIVEVDATGEVITAYIFADNYFELYVNGIPIGKDAIPFTNFNSHIVKFKVSKPYTIAMKLVDWEENLGLGSENNKGNAFQPGDGGMVAVFKDVNGNTVAKTGSDWKAQTFYTAPIKDLSCPTENGNLRISSACSEEGVADGRTFYALHWAIPSNWMGKDFDDKDWPNATIYTNAVIGVDNKPAFTNYTNIFDEPSNDADFIWSTNVVLDNEVIVRYTVK